MTQEAQKKDYRTPAMLLVVKAIRQVRATLEESGATPDEASHAVGWCIVNLQEGAKDLGYDKETLDGKL